MNDNIRATLDAWLDQMNGMREAGLLDNPTRETLHELNGAAWALMAIVGAMIGERRT